MPADGRLFLGVNDDDVERQPGRVQGRRAARIRRLPTGAAELCRTRRERRDAAPALVRPIRRNGVRVQLTVHMPEWKDTLNLPRTTFPMKANLPDGRAGDARAVGGDGPVRADSRARARARRSSSCTTARRTPTATSTSARAQQDPEGLRRQVADDGRLRRAVRAGLRLPRPADRAEGRPRARPEEARDVDRRLPPRLPRVRRALHRRDDARSSSGSASSATGTHPYLTMNFRYQAAIARALGQVRRARARLQGQEAGPLVHPLPHGAGRGGSRVRGSHVAVDLRRVPARPGERGRAGARASRRWPDATSRC